MGTDGDFVSNNLIKLKRKAPPTLLFFLSNASLKRGEPVVHSTVLAWIWPATSKPAVKLLTTIADHAGQRICVSLAIYSQLVEVESHGDQHLEEVELLVGGLVH